MSWGANLKRLRTDRGMTQGDLSEDSGVKLSQISKLERSQADPKLSTIYKLIAALDCSADRLLMDEQKTGIKGVLKEQFERVATLPDHDQETLIKIMDKFCIANGLRTMLDEHRLIMDLSRDGGSVVDSVIK